MRNNGLDFHSYGSHIGSGYGKVFSELTEAFLDNDIEIAGGSKNVLNFCMPKDYKFKDFTVGYTPWESTQVPESWKEPLGRVDDFWTTASWLVPVFKEYVDDVFVLPHGIHSKEFPFIRRSPWDSSRPFRFIHVGESALRKGGDILLEVWDKHFARFNDVELVVKCNKYSTSRYQGRAFASYPNVKVIGNNYSEAELWRELALADCMVYPSRGEGFGLIPFEAMATGLPTIVPHRHMGDFTLDSPLGLEETRLVDSPDQKQHTGKWLDFDIDEIARLMKLAMAEHRYYIEIAELSAARIHSEHSWANIANQAIARLELKGS